MRYPSLVIFLGALALLSAGCNIIGGGGGEQGQEPPAEQPPAGAPPAEQAPAQAPAANPQDAAGTPPNQNAADAKQKPDDKKAAAGASPQPASPQLIRATQPEELARKQKKQRPDPFGNLVVPLVQAGAQQAAGIQPPTQIALVAQGSTSSITTGGSLLSGGNLAVNLGSRIKVAPPTLPQIPNLTPRQLQQLPELPLPIGPEVPDLASVPQVPNLTPRELRQLPELPLPIGPGVPGSGPDSEPTQVPSSPPPTTPSTPPPPPIPPAPEPNLARAIEIQGVVDTVGDEVQIILKAPNEKTPRYVRVGDRVANGEVLVKRVIFNQSSEPIVVLEQNGVEVRRRVGEPAEFPEVEAQLVRTLKRGNKSATGDR